jgi:Outer membrane protein beta-barrel domain
MLPLHRTAVFFYLLVGCALILSELGSAQVVPYAGAIGGFATLSGDAGSQPTPQGLRLSAYAPANGGALDVFAGAHLNNYFSVQGDFIYNRNSLHLNSADSGTGSFYQEDRSSTQEAGVLDLLVYFRNLRSRVRPYLGVGTGVIHLSSTLDRVVAAGGNPQLPPPSFSSTGPLLRSHVGIDLRVATKLDFRYSFSETLGRGEIGKQLSPPGPRYLKNFQNLFGFVVRL